ncbi:MAG: prolyl oligopeptidase family serine peptidase [Betaproteobacteria bacterium]
MPHLHSPLVRSALALLFAATAAAAAAQAKPPVAPVNDVTDTYFGVAVPDPYRYFEDLKNDGVASWMKAQAGHTRAILDRIPPRAAVLKEIAKYGDAASARVSNVQVVGDHVYYEKRLASQNIPKLYVRRGFAGKERLLVDAEATKGAAGEHYSLSYYAPSPDNKYLAYGISASGSEEAVLHVLDVATGKKVGDGIDRAKFASPSWLPDGRVLYERLPKLAPGAPETERYQNIRVYAHKLGTDADADPELLGPGFSPRIKVAPVENPYVFHVPGSRHVIALLINGTQREYRIYAAPLDALAGKDTPWVQIADTADEVTDFTVAGDDIYLMTHKDAPRFKVLRTSLATEGLAGATVAIPQGEAVITGLGAAKDALYVRQMNGGLSDLCRLGFGKDARPTKVTLPFTGDIDSLATDPRVAGVVFNASAWTRFGGYYAYDPATAAVRDTKLQPQGPYDNPAGLVATEVRVKSHDGTMVPLSIVHKKGLKLDGTNPTILWGYGAYGISQTPFYRPTYLPWFERGGIFAVAHVRGGGEYGEEWYKGGYKATKPNTWKDAIAAAEWLVANKYTASSKLAIMGGSAGGIFVGRSITERPDLFGAAIDAVPVSDVVRMEFSANGVGNIPEFGTVKEEAGFKGLYAMSAYHWVKDGTPYPAVLVTTGFNDSRVPAWQAGKMAARLQAATSSARPVLLRIDYDAGHGIGSTKKQAYEERADIFSFLLWQFGVREFQPKP